MLIGNGIRDTTHDKIAVFNPKNIRSININTNINTNHILNFHSSIQYIPDGEIKYATDNPLILSYKGSSNIPSVPPQKIPVNSRNIPVNFPRVTSNLQRITSNISSNLPRLTAKPRIVIIIGLYNTMEYLEDAKKDNNLHVFAFEPNKKIVEQIYQKHTIPSNYHIIEKAISDKAGKRMFNICSETTCSSLQSWGNGPKFGTFTPVEVECLRMDNFVRENKIEEIEYLQIDAQGHDLYVMRSFGYKFRIIKKGVCESMAPHTKWRLYQNQPSFRDFEKFITGQGYGLTWVYNIGSGCPKDEVNITFIKS